jgi:hypothetical protein
MTTNNKVKAPRPCTLWGQTFDSNLVETVMPSFYYYYDESLPADHEKHKSARASILLKCQKRIDGHLVSDKLEIEGKPFFYKTKNEGLFAIQGAENLSKQMFFEAIQAIASAQRPWLKAEGFEFVEGVEYWVKFREVPHILRCTFHKDRRHDDGYEFYFGSRDDFYYEDIQGCRRDLSIRAVYALAFKPISDSQEAWDAVAGVEVYKESTNDTHG